MKQKESHRDVIQTAVLADLPLAAEQAEETKAGAGDVSLLGPPARTPKPGGFGNDVLLGGAGDDLLIGGTTSY
jgi:hypothetical protein